MSANEEPGLSEVLGIVRDLVAELRGTSGRAVEVAPQSRLDRDLGIDSLARTELALRIERQFRIRLPTQAVAEIDTVGELAAAVAQIAPAETLQNVEPASLALPAAAAATQARTLIEALDWHAERHADRLHATVLEDETRIVGRTTYRELRDDARRVAAGLVTAGIEAGDRVAIMLPTSLDFFTSFFAILYAGAIPVPIYPPARMSQIEDHLRRQAGILRNAGARMLITVPEGRSVARLIQAQLETLSAIETVAQLRSETDPSALPGMRDPKATALIQYTSGSTGDPKGVVLSHANLLTNIRAMCRALEARSEDVFVSWLPLYHDMGLIGAWLGSLYQAVPLYVMSPISFLVRPESWLWTIHRYRGTLSAAPNFAFELCLNKVRDIDIEGLDLSSLRMVANGAEPVNPDTLRRFTERFSKYGFRPEAMAPVYGLAECAVGLAFPPLGRKPVIDRIDRDALMRRGVAERARTDQRAWLEFVACGQPLADHEIRVVDEQGRELPERHEGRLEFRGPSTTTGYFQNEAKTRELIRDGWHDSGDRAYVAGNDIFLTGRIKDIIIRGGRNVYPHQVEQAAGEVAGIRRGGVAAFGLYDAERGTERLVVIAETRSTESAERAALEERVREVVTDILGEPPDEIVLTPPRTVPKTSSGKIRRSAAREMYRKGQIPARERALWGQLLRLGLIAAGQRLRRFIRSASHNLYAAWWWLVLAILGTSAWLAVIILPPRAWRWSVIHALARAGLAAMGIPLTISGRENIPPEPAVFAFNHASYADALALAAALPGEPAFVAKKELARQAVAGPFLRRLGSLFVERFELSESVADAQMLADAARGGTSLVFFPEGTFTRKAGLAGFHLGAFRVASEAGVPVVPGAICGTRSLLRSNQWFPHRVAIDVRFGRPLRPAGADFTSVVSLRDDVRAVILSLCGEPDLQEIADPPAA